MSLFASLLKNSVIMDIETSGLSKDQDFITCIGLMTSSGIHQVTQPASVFRDDPMEAENNLLAAFDAMQGSFSDKFLITYNGISFDVPFINDRFSTQNLNSVFAPTKHLDLMQYSREIHGRHVKKDDTARHLCNLYVPWSCSAAYLARVYKSQCVSEEDHMHMLAHNALDLTITAQMLGRMFQFDSFHTFINKNKIEVD